MSDRACHFPDRRSPILVEPWLFLVLLHIPVYGHIYHTGSGFSFASYTALTFSIRVTNESNVVYLDILGVVGCPVLAFPVGVVSRGFSLLIFYFFF